MVDFKAVLAEAHKKSAEKCSAYLLAEEKLVEEANGAFNKELLEKLIIAKKEWQSASDSLYDLYAVVKMNP